MITVDLFRSSKTKHPVYSCNYNRERSAGTKLVSLYFQNSIFIWTDKWFLPIFAFKQLPDNTSLMVWVLRIKLLRRRAAGRFCPLCAFSLSSSQKRPKIPTSDVNTQCTILTFVTVFSVSDASPSCCRFFAGWPTSCVWFCSSLKKSLFNWRRPCSHSLTVVDVFFFCLSFSPTLCPASFFSYVFFVSVPPRIFSALQPSPGLLWTGPSAPHQKRVFLFRLALKDWPWLMCGSHKCVCFWAVVIDRQLLHACVVKAWSATAFL